MVRDVDRAKEMLKLAQVLKLHIPSGANRPRIAKIVADKLCDFSNDGTDNDRFNLPWHCVARQPVN